MTGEDLETMGFTWHANSSEKGSDFRYWWRFDVFDICASIYKCLYKARPWLNTQEASQGENRDVFTPLASEKD